MFFLYIPLINMLIIRHDKRRLCLNKKTLTLTTWEMLRSRPAYVTFEVISKETGLSKDWLRSFLKRGNEKGAICDNIEALYNCLSPNKLEY